MNTVIDYTQSQSQSEKWTREQFIEHHRNGSGLAPEEWDRYLVAFKCDCGEDFCHGWRAVPNTPALRRELRGGA